ncbi:hypothetical protein RMSM_06624 [Rhodopirellula maiorica SM1]|uniref:Uncharacterized protein n=1 Tax=Rhodopirellula maiorica SM1 TaxID=1265738 RepID=M5RBM4_9BACT|nr:hypothetical protein RMSM_06624 [Rhodopirellula maiorica SM1]
MQETHILMQDLQKRLSLAAPAPEAITVDEVKDTKPAGKASAKKDSKEKTKKSTTAKKEKQRGLFGGLFRRAK